MLSLIVLAVAAFAATNVDNLFVLLAFVAEARGKIRSVMVGQYAGSLALIVFALGLAAMLRSLPPGYVGVLGVLPISVGLSKAWTRFGRRKAVPADTLPGAASPDQAGPQHTPQATQQATPQAAPQPARQAGSSWLTVAAVAIANGSDNIAVYVPLYAGHSADACALISLVFVVMIGIWCAGAVWLVNHPLLGAPIRRYGTALLPFILLVIGVSVIVENDTLHLLFGL
jgi:cadmium resistance protein CadD (predicted permease)